MEAVTHSLRAVAAVTGAWGFNPTATGNSLPPSHPFPYERIRPVQGQRDMKVRDVMTYGVISVPESASIAEAIETMLRSRVSALVVFDADHELSGILSEGDLLRRSELGSEAKKRPYWLELLIGSGRIADAYTHEHGAK